MTHANSGPNRPVLRRWVLPAVIAALAAYAAIAHEQAGARLRMFEKSGQAEAIREISASQLPHLRSAVDLAAALRGTFENPGVDFETTEKRDLKAAYDALRKQGEQNDLASLLGAAVSTHQLSVALNRLFAKHAFRCMDPDIGAAVTRRWRELLGITTGDELNIEVSLRASAVSLPSPSDDIIRLDAQILSGAPVDRLLPFMAAHKLMKEDPDDVRERWRKPDASIGADDPAADGLEKCLAVEIAGSAPAPDTPDHSVQYVYSDHTGFVWRAAEVAVYYPALFNAARYPFDTTAVVLFLTADRKTPMRLAARLRLMPRENIQRRPLDRDFTSPPRGFYFSRQLPNLEPVAAQRDADRPPRSALLYIFELSRRLHTAAWRTFAPAVMIVIFGFLATLSAIKHDDGVNGVATNILSSLLPTLTVAAVALQLTASTIIPPNVGGTVMDKMFVAIYLHIFCLFLALRTRGDKRISRILVALSLAPLAYAAHFFFFSGVN